MLTIFLQVLVTHIFYTVTNVTTAQYSVRELWGVVGNTTTSVPWFDSQVYLKWESWYFWLLSNGFSTKF